MVKHSFQIYSLALVVTSLLVSLLLYQTKRSTVTETKTILQRIQLLKVQRERVLHFDEILTMSARMAVLTGDKKWVERYYQYVEPLDEALATLQENAPDLQSKEFAERTEQANRELIAMEEKAFALLQQGEKQQARNLLFSEAYAQQKTIYTEGMQESNNSLTAHISALEENLVAKQQANNYVFWLLCGGLFVLWLLFYVRLRSYRRQVRRGEMAELEQSTHLALLGEIAAGMGHDLKNPLAIIQLSLEQLQRKHPELAAEKALTKIHRAIELASKMIYNLESLAKKEKGERFEEHSLGELAAEAILFAEKRLRFSNLLVGESVRCVFPAAITVVSDRNHLVQVLINLLQNAADAVVEQKNPWVEIDARTEGKDVLIMVTDSGQGIAADLQDKIFNAQFSTKERQKGTGLGLSLSKKLIERLGGSLSLDSSHPHTRFVIRLPAAKAHASSASSPKAS